LGNPNREKRIVVANTEVRVVRAYDSVYGNGKHAFSIVADDNSAQFIFPNGSQLFDGKARMKRLTSDKSKKSPSTANDWIRLAIKGLGSYELSVVTLAEDVNTVQKAVKIEKDTINSEENSIASSLGLSVEDQNTSSTMEDLMVNNEEFANFVEGDVEELSDDTMKQYITDLIVSAGTLEENPWLEPWLNGEDITTLDFSKGLVLNKPAKKFEDFQSNFDSSLFEEEETN
jgi:hypothetical protein